MTVTAMSLQTLRGTKLALDKRRRDALATYAIQAAEDAGQPPQTWVRQTWGLKDYEAKHLLKGDASEATFERLLKRRGPHCGWRLALPILGAIIGEDLADHFQREKAEVAHERARYAAEEARISALETHARERRALGRVAAGQGAVQGRRADGEPGLAAPRVGGRAAR